MCDIINTCILICFNAICIKLIKDNIVFAIILGIIITVITVIFHCIKRKHKSDDEYLFCDYKHATFYNLKETKINLKSSNAKLIELLSEYNKNSKSEVEKNDDL